jgi:hypothetical protein
MELAKKYEIIGTPSMVNGEYRFDLGTASGPEGSRTWQIT